MNGRALLVALAVLAGFAESAAADPFIIRPGDYAVGTDLSSLFPGVTLSTIRLDGSEAPVYASSTVYAGAINTLTLGMSSMLHSWSQCNDRRDSNPSSPCTGEGNYPVLEILFDTPTNFVQIGAVWFSDNPGLQAFDAAGNQISGCGTFGSGCASLLNWQPSGTTTALTVAREQGDISRIVFGGVIGNSEAYEVRYERVPEPTTLAAMAVGIVGAGISGLRRRRRRDES
jgi:hypothetical protein